MRSCMLALAFCLLVSPAAYARWLPNGEFLIDTARLNAPGPSYDPAVAFDGTNYLVVWEDFRNRPFETDIYAVRVSPTGQVLDPQCIQICAEDGDQSYPAVAFDGVNFVVAWQDESDGQPEIYAARVSTSGQVLEQFPVVRQPANQYAPRLARGAGNQLLLAYESWTGTYQGRLFNIDRI